MNLWLSKLRPDLHHRGVAGKINNPVELHRLTMKLFPNNLGDTPRKAAGVLFRLDQDRDGPVVLIQSTHQPEAQKLPTGWGTITTKPMAGFLDAITTGRPVHYRLAAVTVRRISRTPKPGRKPGQILPLTGSDADQWWQRQAATAGLSLTTAESQMMTTPRGKTKEDKPDIVLPQHLFEGRAIIADSDALRTALVHGLGRGKAYGCGLLSLAPAT